jgi:ethanolamine utilization protein EutP (predicted NTPase)
LQLVLEHRDQILAVEADFSTVHNELSTLLRKHEANRENSSLPPNFAERCTVDLEAVIAKADWLLENFPPLQIVRQADSSVKTVIEQSR